MRSYQCSIRKPMFLKKSFRVVKAHSSKGKTNNILFQDLVDDKDVYGILQDETERQICSMELIASENFTSRAVMQANGTIFTNKYSEGYPGNRYYGGNEFIDELETLPPDLLISGIHIKVLNLIQQNI